MEERSARGGVTPSGEQRGFTLVELLVVIAILGTLAALLLPVEYRAIGRISYGRQYVGRVGCHSA